MLNFSDGSKLFRRPTGLLCLQLFNRHHLIATAEPVACFNSSVTVFQRDPPPESMGVLTRTRASGQEFSSQTADDDAPQGEREQASDSIHSLRCLSELVLQIVHIIFPW